MEQVFGVLFSLYKGKSINDEWIIACLDGAWPKLLGGKLSTVCRPASFKNSELVIDIVESGWDDAVRSVQPELLTKLTAATAGHIQRIKIRGMRELAQ